MNLRGKKWLRFGDLKIEAAVFMLVALSFAAVLGQSAITSEEFRLTPHSGQYYTYTYVDKENGGTSAITANPSIPMRWQCTMNKGFAYPYCGYGLFLDSGQTHKGKDIRHLRDITIRFNYHGGGSRLKLVVKNLVPAKLKKKVPDSEASLFAEFEVVQGQNEVHLLTDQLATESWWVDHYHLTPEEAVIALDNVVSVAIASGDQPVPSTFDIAVDSISFKGAFLTTSQWYLMILGVWLVATGAFLVFRFLGLRRTYAERQSRQAEEARVMAEARAAAEDASAAKTQFLANMSHELRTPLNAIIGYAQLLKVRDFSRDDIEAIKTIEHSGEHLLTMITDILDISKVEAGKLELLPAPFDIRGCVYSVGQMMRLRADQKGLGFAVSVEADVPGAVAADQKRIRQVLLNLLGNAIKFTEAGEVRLNVSVVTQDDNVARLRFEISDTGIGIPADHIDRIFRPFEQSGNAIDRSGGTGLGLSISHKIIQMMGGEIKVESELGKGSCFRVEAEFFKADASGQKDFAEDWERASFEVLVVDDVEANRSFLCNALQARGFHVRAASSGLEAISLLESALSDLVLMDLKMPVMNGLETIGQIRGRSSTQSLPIIAITANPSAQAQTAVEAAGAQIMLSKPIDLVALDEAMREILTSRPVSNMDSPPQSLRAPQGEILARLLKLSREGDLKAIRREIPAILDLGAEYTAFAERLDSLAAAYQSPAVLRLIEDCTEEKNAA